MRMSKKFGVMVPLKSLSNTRSWARFAAVLLLLSAIFAGPTWFRGSAQRVSQSAATAASARNAALVGATNEVLKETSQIRQLSILRQVQSSTQSRPEIERALIKDLDDDMTPAQIHATEITMRRLGLAPSDFQYRPLMIRLLTEQIAGYYDPKTQWFHLADWIDLDGQRPIMAHELTHALQDQHFNLRRFEHWPKGDSDAELAAHALIEGDATLAMALYVASNPLRALMFLKSLGTSGMPSEELDKAPRILRETLLFPYQDGEKWASALYKRGGWNLVSDAFTDLPASTEQILHPEKYFAHEAPIKITLPDLSSLLNSTVLVKKNSSSRLRSADEASWRRIDSDVNGEWGFYLILDEYLKSANESRRAAEGWGGDRYAVYEDPRGESFYVSLSAWDTEADARQFFDAYNKRATLRYPDAINESQQNESNTSVLHTHEGLVSIELRGNRVLVLEGVPAEIRTKELRDALWK